MWSLHPSTSALPSRKVINIIGNKYNHFTVLSFAYSKTVGDHTRTYWNCKCDCGNVVTLRKDAFAYSYSSIKSCGCWHKTESALRPRDLKTGKFIKLNIK